MPVMTGLEFLNSPEGRSLDIPVILITAHNDKAIRAQAKGGCVRLSGEAGGDVGLDVGDRERGFACRFPTPRRKEIPMVETLVSIRNKEFARDAFAHAMRLHFARKLFDESKKVAPEDLRYILEAGRLSPSSLGLEPWRFIVVRDAALRRRLRPAC